MELFTYLYLRTCTKEQNDILTRCDNQENMKRITTIYCRHDKTTEAMKQKGTCKSNTNNTSARESLDFINNSI